ncbi:putative NADH-flavin reductase [Psychromicrobium silvestre]|uniref:Putative NADH-flavin reductase n=1 Tax=Psychromicrobium silvestre TaxID=1645614 RepID=A0A7Y9LQV6_9MICC|nr:NAD(P)-binding oxidoreductase [Psychromicrobium silvestre]NYE93925.1 putative NADH-flavin reductase [Psychromicrobium silvestre]
MELTIFGASGRIGQQLVSQALAAGHQVTAVVRQPGDFPLTGAGLQVFGSPVRDDVENLRRAVAGRQAVLSGLGPRSRKDAGITTPLTRAIVQAMEAESVKRLLVVSAAPLGPTPVDEPFWLAKIATPLISAILKGNYDDLRAMEAELASSNLDWTSVRPPRLLDKPLRGNYRSAIDGNPRAASSIGRADVAAAMLSMIDDPATFRHPVGVAY